MKFSRNNASLFSQCVEMRGFEPLRSVDPRFGLFPVRSPLLGKSIFLSLPPAT